MIIYLYSKCSTCQDALRFLKEKKIVVAVREITIQPPTVEELRKMLAFQQGHLKKLLNTSGMLYRELGLSEKIPSMRVDEVLSLLSQQGMLIKRPFLIGEGFGLTGFHPTAWSQAIEVSTP